MESRYTFSKLGCDWYNSTVPHGAGIGGARMIMVAKLEVCLHFFLNEDLNKQNLHPKSDAARQKQSPHTRSVRRNSNATKADAPQTSLNTRPPKRQDTCRTN